MINIVGATKLNRLEKILNIVINIKHKTIRLFPRYIIIFFMLRINIKIGIIMIGSGIMEVVNFRFGFLRSIYNNYYSGINDIYISLQKIKKFSLKTGDMIIGKVIPPSFYERYFSLIDIMTINYIIPKRSIKRVDFDNLVPLYPNFHLNMEKKKIIRRIKKYGIKNNS